MNLLQRQGWRSLGRRIRELQSRIQERKSKSVSIKSRNQFRRYIGKGKVVEIKRAMASLSCFTVIFDNELTPGQQQNLETEFGGEKAGIKVLDRTAVILDIFAQHARTKEGQLQVGCFINKKELINML